MKQKTSNIIYNTVSILLCIILLSIAVWGIPTRFDIKVWDSAVAVINESSVLDKLLTIAFITLICFNLLFAFLNRKNIKLLIVYCIPIIFYIALLTTLGDSFSNLNNLSTICLAINIILNILGIVLNFINKKENECSKTSRIIYIISILIITVILIINIIYYAMFLIKLYEADNQISDFIEQLREKVSKINTNIALISVQKDGKYGFIDKTGKEIIPCIYDYAAFDQIDYFTGKESIYSKYAIAQKDDTFYYILRNGDIILSNDKTPIPNFEELKDSILKNDETRADADIYMVLFSLVSMRDYEDDLYYSNANEINDKLLVPVDKDYFEDITTYNLKNGYTLELIENKYNNYSSHKYEDSEDKYNLSIKKDNKEIKAYENVSIPFDYYSDNIETYSDGSIPFYNLETKIQGFINQDNGDIFTLNGDFQILDVLNDKIVVRDYRNTSDTRDMIVSKKSNELLFSAKEINVLKNGYVIKKDNDKMVYLDSNLKEQTKEFDEIYRPNETDRFDDVLVCISKNNGVKEYNLYDTNGKKLTNNRYQSIGCSEFDGFILDEKYYEHYYTDNDD